jgi:hypothetical protein
MKGRETGVKNEGGSEERKAGVRNERERNWSKK